MTTKIEVTAIERDVPIPPVGKAPGGKPRVFPVAELEVGESFEFPIEKRPTVQSSASHVKRDTGREFTVRKIDDVTGRIWRTA